jgi:hypothetical protein
MPKCRGIDDFDCLSPVRHASSNDSADASKSSAIWRKEVVQASMANAPLSIIGVAHFHMGLAGISAASPVQRQCGHLRIVACARNGKSNPEHQRECVGGSARWSSGSTCARSLLPPLCVCNGTAITRPYVVFRIDLG